MRVCAGDAELKFQNVVRSNVFGGVRLNIEACNRAKKNKRGQKL